MPEDIYEIVVLVEAPADFITATCIAEKAIQEYANEWLRDLLELAPSAIFSWVGLNSNTSFSCWSGFLTIQSQYEQTGYRPPKFLGHKLNPGYDYAAGWKILRLIDHIRQTSQRNIPAVLFIRDSDDQTEQRLDSLLALREGRHDQETQIIIGFAIPKREAWVLNGFNPLNEKEIEALRRVITEIHFDPRSEAHRLRGRINQPGTESRDIKRVLERLLGSDPQREMLCWQTTSIETLIENGRQTGLSAFIEDIRILLIPILEKGKAA